MKNEAMKKDEVIKTLKQHNDWRTDKNIPPSSKMIEPSVITEAINRAIELLSDHIDKENLTPDVRAKYERVLSRLNGSA